MSSHLPSYDATVPAVVDTAGAFGSLHPFVLDFLHVRPVYVSASPAEGRRAHRRHPHRRLRDYRELLPSGCGGICSPASP